ncbi:hypothetical protein VPH35_099288 [Triticum aestivum]|uniref:Uncharacterized protein n=2 Tax=Aegilops tauschii subsp. strangulata TaxID=200361 RepID=A0A453LIH2_AEGTS
MEWRNAASISAEALLLSKHIAYSIIDASQGSVILPLSTPAKPNSSWDILKSSPKTVVPRNASGTSNLTPSVVYTMKCPLPATDEHDVPHGPPVSSADVDDDQANCSRQKTSSASTPAVLQQLQTANLFAGSNGQRDLAMAREAKLLPRHPQELANDRRAEVQQRDLEAPPVGRVHDAVALGRCRGAASLVFLGRHGDAVELGRWLDL